MAEGMVYALHEIHRVLKPAGILLDMRPAIGNYPIEVDLSYATLYVGEVNASASTSDKQSANHALAQAVDEGWFVQEHHETVELITYIDTVDDLREYGQSFRRSILPDAVITQVASLTADEDLDTFTIRVRRKLKIARYHKV